MNLKGSKTEKNLKDAFAGESQANRRYLYFAQKADVEGFNDVSAVFRSTAEGETGHAHGHLEYLEAVGDPATGLQSGSSLVVHWEDANTGVKATGGSWSDSLVVINTATGETLLSATVPYDAVGSGGRVVAPASGGRNCGDRQRADCAVPPS